MFVDPLAEKYPGWTPYHYVHNNPINMIDPTGMEADGWGKRGNTWEYDAEITADNYKDKGYSEYRESTNIFSTTGGKADGDYNFSLNKDGSVQDKSGNYMNSSFTTPYGTNIKVNQNESTFGSRLSADFTNSYSSSGIRSFVNWWKYNDLAGGTGGLIINGIGGQNMGVSDMPGPYKHINVTDLPGFSAPGQNVVQKVMEGLTKLISLGENDHVKGWFNASKDGKVIRESGDTVFYRVPLRSGFTTTHYKLKSDKKNDKK